MSVNNEVVPPPGIARWHHDLLENHTTRLRQHDELYGHPEPLTSWSQEIFLDHVHPDDRAHVLEELANATVQGILDVTYRVVWADGNERWLRSYGTTEYDERGEAIQMSGVLIDITDSKALEVRVEELVRSLAQAQKLAVLGQLVSGIVHDFNNLLTVIVGGAEALRASASSAEDQELAAMLLAAGERGGDQTRRLLALGHKYVGTASAVQPATIVGEVTRLLRRSFPPGVTLQADDGGHQTAVVVDPALFEAAILNLTVNSLAAVEPSGTITISIDHLLDTNEVAISVADDGHGMTPDVQQHAFEHFFTTRAEAGGTGLGLPMVQAFARDAGGDVIIDSEPGAGTVVQIVLPAVPEPAAIEPHGDDTLPVRGGSERVLMVEDDEDVRRMALRALRALGYHVRLAGAADEAWELLQRFWEGPSSDRVQIDLVITNVVTPGAMSGVELADRIHASIPDLPIVLTIGYETSTSHDPSLFAASLPKPYRSSDLARLVRELLDGRPPDATYANDAV